MKTTSESHEKKCQLCGFTWTSKDESCPVRTLVDYAMTAKKSAVTIAGHIVTPTPHKEFDGTWLVHFNLKRENTFSWNIKFPLKCTTRTQAETLIHQIATEILGTRRPEKHETTTSTRWISNQYS